MIWKKKKKIQKRKKKEKKCQHDGQPSQRLNSGSSTWGSSQAQNLPWKMGLRFTGTANMASTMSHQQAAGTREEMGTGRKFEEFTDEATACSYTAYTLRWEGRWTNGWDTVTSAGAASARLIKHADQRKDNTRNRTIHYRSPCCLSPAWTSQNNAVEQAGWH